MRAQKYHHGLREKVSRLHRAVQCWVVDAALGALPPADDAVAVGLSLARTAHGCPGIMRESAEIVHEVGKEPKPTSSEADRRFFGGGDSTERRGSLPQGKFPFSIFLPRKLAR